MSTTIAAKKKKSSPKQTNKGKETTQNNVFPAQNQAESGNDGPTYRYSDEELGEFRVLIDGKLTAARKELTYLQGLITRKDEHGDDGYETRHLSVDTSQVATEKEQLNQLASRQIQFIGHLEKALIRIANKTYGVCRVTGKLISKERLHAVPHATLSIEAKKSMEKKN